MTEWEMETWVRGSGDIGYGELFSLTVVGATLFTDNQRDSLGNILPVGCGQPFASPRAEGGL